MGRKQLEATFNWKISSELKLFKMEMLKKDKEELIGNAYFIANMIEVYEFFVELCPSMSEEELLYCIETSSLLLAVYEEWTKIPDCQYQEKENSIRSLINNKNAA